jgi:tetratricopeptide (TPR) repeat protein
MIGKPPLGLSQNNTKSTAIDRIQPSANLDDWNLRFEKAMKLAWSGSYSASLAELKFIAAQRPDLVMEINENGRTQLPVKLALAEVLNWSGEMNESQLVYESYVKEKPDDLQAVQELAEILSYQPAQQQQAYSMLSDILAKNPQASKARLNLATIDIWQQRYQDAQTELTLLLKTDPNNGEVHKQQGILFLALERPGQALPEFLLAAKLQVPDVEITDGIGQSLLRLGRASEAEALYRQGIISFPNESKMHIGLAESSGLQNKSEESIKQLDQALLMNPRPSDLSDFADYLSQTARLRPLAALVCRDVLKTQPDNAPCLRVLGEMLTWSPKTRTEGIDLLRKYLVLKPDDPIGKECLAEGLGWEKAKDKKKEALKIYDELLVSEPDNLDLLGKRAEVLSWSGKIAVAQKEYKHILQEDPDNLQALIGMGQCLSWSADNLKAEKVLQGAAELYPNDGRIMLERAINFREMGRLDLAKKYGEQCSNNLPEE